MDTVAAEVVERSGLFGLLRKLLLAVGGYEIDLFG